MRCESLVSGLGQTNQRRRVTFVFSLTFLELRRPESGFKKRKQGIIFCVV